MTGRKESRQRLRPWLLSILNNNKIPGVRWLDNSPGPPTRFRIPWTHRSKKSWTEQDSKLALEWARQTGKYSVQVDTPDHSKYKHQLSGALGKAPFLRELKHLRVTDGDDPHRVYELTESAAAQQKLKHSQSASAQNQVKSETEDASASEEPRPSTSTPLYATSVSSDGGKSLIDVALPLTVQDLIEDTKSMSISDSFDEPKKRPRFEQSPTKKITPHHAVRGNQDCHLRESAKFLVAEAGHEGRTFHPTTNPLCNAEQPSTDGAWNFELTDGVSFLQMLQGKDLDQKEFDAVQQALMTAEISEADGATATSTGVVGEHSYAVVKDEAPEMFDPVPVEGTPSSVPFGITEGNQMQQLPVMSVPPVGFCVAPPQQATVVSRVSTGDGTACNAMTSTLSEVNVKAGQPVISVGQLVLSEPAVQAIPENTGNLATASGMLQIEGLLPPPPPPPLPFAIVDDLEDVDQILMKSLDVEGLGSNKEPGMCRVDTPSTYQQSSTNMAPAGTSGYANVPGKLLQPASTTGAPMLPTASTVPPIAVLGSAFTLNGGVGSAPGSTPSTTTTAACIIGAPDTTTLPPSNPDALLMHPANTGALSVQSAMADALSMQPAITDALLVQSVSTDALSIQAALADALSMDPANAYVASMPSANADALSVQPDNPDALSMHSANANAPSMHPANADAPLMQPAISMGSSTYRPKLETQTSQQELMQDEFMKTEVETSLTDQELPENHDEVLAFIIEKSSQ